MISVLDVRIQFIGQERITLKLLKEMLRYELHLDSTQFSVEKINAKSGIRPKIKGTDS